MTLAAVILAAGQGTRMKSALPKVLHPLGGQPLVAYALAAVEAAAPGVRPVLVVGHGAEAVRAALGDRVAYAEQAEQLGTGHAVLQAAPLLAGAADFVLITYADMPLLRAETLQALAATQAENPGPLTLLVADAPALRDFGRVVRGDRGQVLGVVEAAQATPEQAALTEVNVGAYCARADWLWAALAELPLSPRGEYYLTDLVARAAAAGGAAAVPLADLDEVIGINNRAQLAEAETALRRRLNHYWMLAGVTLVDPATTYLGPNVELLPDTVIEPNTHLEGHTRVGRGCRLGPNTLVRDSQIGNDCRVEASVLEGATLADEVSVGPFAHLRRGARLERGAHMGNFGEVKNSTLGPGVKMGHFSYVGDAVIGAETNIGAGTITCNFDGQRKHKTVVGERAFIGSDTLLVAPVTLGDGARTGAGSVVTHDVPAHSLAFGVPARVVRRLDEQAGR